MHLMKDRTYVIEHIMRGRWNTLDREAKLKEVCENDQRTCPNYRVWIEQEPGSGGKESVEASIRNLAPIIAYADKVTGAKEVRAEPFCAAVQNGSVGLVAGEWVHAFRDECEAWPNAKYLDQVDAAAGAFNHLASATTYDSTYAAFDPYYQDR
jgi:predicted phage terminase large subunit-like protein